MNRCETNGCGRYDPAYGPPPLDTFAPAPSIGLFAHFARRGGYVDRRPVVGWVTCYCHDVGDDTQGEGLQLDVEPAVMGRNGWVARPREVEEAGGGALIGIYPAGDDPHDVDHQQYQAVMRAVWS